MESASVSSSCELALVTPLLLPSAVDRLRAHEARLREDEEDAPPALEVDSEETDEAEAATALELGPAWDSFWILHGIQTVSCMHGSQPEASACLGAAKCFDAVS